MADPGSISRDHASVRRTAWRRVSWAFAALCVLLSPHAARTAEPAAARPNIVLFLIDDLGWTDLGHAGSKLYQTPHVDRMAAQGMRFTAAYSACTVCSPTRAALLTGKYPARLQTDWIPGHKRPSAKLQIPDWRPYLPLEEITLAEALKSAGYATAAIGKWHLGGEPYAPAKQGFDVAIGGDHRGQTPSYFFPYNLPGLSEGADGEYLTDRLAEEAVRFIDAHRAGPFFLYAPHYAVHTPIQAPPELVQKYRARVSPTDEHRNAAYAALVERMDAAIGRVLTRLDELGMTDHTIVIFTSDNGGYLGGPKPRITSNAPLRSGKGSAYEGGVRVPLVVRWPGMVRAGSMCDVPVCWRPRGSRPRRTRRSTAKASCRCSRNRASSSGTRSIGTIRTITPARCWPRPMARCGRATIS
jgi:arylsulfatase A-like enzyme